MSARILVPCLLVFAGMICVQAQSTVELRLVSRDVAGNAVAVAGTLEDLSTGVSRKFETDLQGRYVFKNLPLGRYRLEASKTGFAATTALIDVQSAAPVQRIIMMNAPRLAFDMEIVGTTPLPGAGLKPDEIPSPIQSATRREIESSGANDLSDFLNRRLGSVFVNEVQGNPFQPDVSYRGYTASPLLGTPQGISVYLDGVRLNQPFGDVVSWDLIPKNAIQEMTLIPGSNPLFGLNTLGGSIAIHTRDGLSAPGTSLQIGGGNFGRKTAEIEHGGASANGFHWYGASTLFFEDGWRENSPSNVRQFFGKIGWQGASTWVGFTAAYANNSLIGNGLQEQRFLDRDYRSIYTQPDITSNRAPFLNLTARHGFNSRLLFSGNAYYRSIRTKTLNGDVNEDSLDQSLYQPNAAERAVLAAAGYSGFPVSGESAANTPFPSWRCIANALLKDEPAEKCNGLINRTRTEQHNGGLSGQLTLFSAPGGQRNQLTIGAAYDRSSVGFLQSSQLGYLNPDRSITGVDAFGDGVNGGEADGTPYDARVDLHGRIQTAGVFATDTLSLGNAWSLMIAGRYNRTTIENRDRILPGGGAGSLDGDHVFQRFNPALGLSFRPWRALNAYASYTEGSRAPTSVELGCADPQTPCKLPNAMAGDPPLDQVVTRTWEAGLRGDVEQRMNWNLGWFRADNRRDILFVASEQTGFGYFKNFGKTLRHGMKFDLNARFWRIGLGGGYTWLKATFESPEEVNGSCCCSNH